MCDVTGVAINEMKHTFRHLMQGESVKIGKANLNFSGLMFGDKPVLVTSSVLLNCGMGARGKALKIIVFH